MLFLFGISSLLIKSFEKPSEIKTSEEQIKSDLEEKVDKSSSVRFAFAFILVCIVLTSYFHYHYSGITWWALVTGLGVFIGMFGIFDTAKQKEKEVLNRGSGRPEGRNGKTTSKKSNFERILFIICVLS